MTTAADDPDNNPYAEALRQPMPAWLYMVLLCLTLAGSTILVLTGTLRSDLLYLLIFPAIVAAIYYDVGIYLAAYGLTIATHVLIELIRGSSPSVIVLGLAAVWLVLSVAITRKMRRLFGSYERALAELDERRDFAESLVNTAQVIILIMDPQCRVMRINPATERLIGLRQDEVIGEHWFNRFVPEPHRTLLRDSLEGLTDQTIPQGYINPITGHDDQQHLIAWNHERLVTHEGAPAGTLAIGHDVTEWVRAETALQERERLYRTLVEHLGEGIGIVSPENEAFTFANPAAHTIFGVPEGCLVGHTLAEFTDPDDFEIIRRETRLRREGEQSSYELTIRRPNGERRYILVTAVPQQGPDGALSGTLGIFRDVTGRHNTLAAFERRAAQLALLGEISKEITAELDLHSLQQRAVTLAQATFGYDHVALLVIGADRRTIRMAARAGVMAQLFPFDHTLDLTEGLVGWALRHGETVTVDDVSKDQRYVNHYPDRIATRAELCVPLRVRGEVIGVIDVQQKESGALGADDARILELLAGQLGVAMGNAQLYEALQTELEERLRAENALRDSQERLSLALEGASLGVWEWDVQSNALSCSPQAATMLGYSLADVPRTAGEWWDMIHPDDRPGVDQAIRSHLGGSAPIFASEQRMRTQGGEWLWIMARGRILATNEQELPQRVAGTLLNITARKEAELALRDLNASLESQIAARTAELLAERDKTSAILETTGDAIALVGPDMSVEYVNPTFETLTGYQAPEIQGRSIQTLVAAPHVVDEIGEGMRHTVTTGQPWNGEMVLRRQNGTHYDALVQIAAVPGPQGTVAGYLASHRDITQLKTLQRMQSRFIANVSHELRTPITVLKLYTDLLPSAPAEKRGEYEQALSSELENLSRLVRDVLRVNTLSSGDIRLDRRPTSLNYLIRELVLQQCESLRRDHSPEIVVSLGESAPVADIDPQWLVEALCQIIDNAVSRTPPEGKITIAADSHHVDGRPWALIRISDTGKGIPLHEQSLVFERFFRGTRSDESPDAGTGLGLSIAKAVVELHGGEILVESEIGESTTIIIWLPANDAAA